MQAREVQSVSFRFHDNHGKNIVLSHDSRTAERREGCGDGGQCIVISRDPMEVNKVYKVRLDETDGRPRKGLPVGVVTSPPDSLTLPDRPWYWKCAVVLYNGTLDDRGERKMSILGKALCDLAPGGHMGLSIDARRYLHLIIDGEYKGVISHYVVPHPCYAMFVVQNEYKKVTALPVTTFEKKGL